MEIYAEKTHTEPKYARILDLITLWQEFEAHQNAGDLQGNNALHNFHLWLGKRLDHDEHASESTPVHAATHKAEAGSMLAALKAGANVHGYAPSAKSPHSMTTRAVDGHYANMLGVDTRINVLIGRMWRFAKFYVKKALDGQEISTLDEFTFLATIKRAGTPTKTEVYVENITEITTGTEILRRMIKAGFVEEFPDTEDRRVKRLQLTSAGLQALTSSFTQLREVARIVVGTLDEDQKNQLAGMLNDLDIFHTNIYADQRSDSIERMVEKNLAPA
jgi:DNA-binding MarR family transcriptional regulator